MGIKFVINKWIERNDFAEIAVYYRLKCPKRRLLSPHSRNVRSDIDRSLKFSQPFRARPSKSSDARSYSGRRSKLIRNNPV